MNPCFRVDEILRLFACELVESEANATAAALAYCCKSFEEPVLDALWEKQERLIPLLKCIPQDVWEEEYGEFVSPPTVSSFLLLNCLIWKIFKRTPTKAEWAHSRKYARRMRKIVVDTSEDIVSSDVLLALHLRTVNDPWLPRLREFGCMEATEVFIPFIHLFLNPETTAIDIGFAEDIATVVVAPTISSLSTLCPNLESIGLGGLPRDPVITEAVSEMLLACNRDTLEVFHVDTPLTEEAREVVYRLPKLCSLWAVIQGPTFLPKVALPNLDGIQVEYDHDHNWLQGFGEAALERLEVARFYSESERIGDFLEAFKSVTFATSTQNTLSTFEFHTPRSWNPNYSSLLSFSQLNTLVIEFSCEGSCSSTLDDDTIVSLAQAMPKLEVLQLGRGPCATRTGVTVNGLTGLAHRCPRLSKLSIHFQAFTLIEAAAGATVPSSSDKPVSRREDCALTDLEVGDTPISAGLESTVAQTLLQIFPHILNVEYTNRGWETIANTIKDSRQVGAFARCSGKPHMSQIL